MNLFDTILSVYISKRTLGTGPTVVGVLCGLAMLVLLTASLVLSGGVSRRASQSGKGAIAAPHGVR